MPDLPHPPSSGGRSPAGTVAAWGDARPGCLLHLEHLPGRVADPVDIPGWVPPELVHALEGDGVTRLWRHQLDTAEALRAGQDVAVTTGTASGKSLGFLLPALAEQVAAATTGSPAWPATLLYLAPTKALAADQAARLSRLELPGVRVALVDGDTPPEDRRWARAHATIVLSNPDFLHHSLLPGHSAWQTFLRHLHYVVIDESHVYRGVFGSHVSAVVRRLRRVAGQYRRDPVFCCASATSPDPESHARALIGVGTVAGRARRAGGTTNSAAPPRRSVVPVTTDGSPRAQQTFALWQPGLVGEDSAVRGGPAPVEASPVEANPVEAEHEGGPRRSALTESADLMAELVRSGWQTLTFARSRRGVEVVAVRAREQLDDPSLAVAAYRGGYLPEDRRTLEREVRSGRLRGIAATNALELGVDIAGLDAVVMAGWPGRRSSLWQQAGRAGRRGEASVAVLVAADDPLDAYLVRHPADIFAAPTEATVFDPANPYVLSDHLLAAAAEVPLTVGDIEVFGPAMVELANALTSRGLLRRRPSGWYWPHDTRPSDRFGLRTAGDPIRITERTTGTVIGTVDEARAHTSVHTGAVHLHQGQTYVVTDLDLDEGTARVVAGDPGWRTEARMISAFDIVAAEQSTDTVEVTESEGTAGPAGGTVSGPVPEPSDGPAAELVAGSVRAYFGRVKVRSQVTSFARRLPNGQVLGEHPLDLPERVLDTRAVWWTIEPAALEAAGVAPDAVPGALHAAEHAAIGLLPLLTSIDRWDIGGVSTACHPDTGLPTVMVYDGYAGGAGFAEYGYNHLPRWLTATRDAIVDCPCADGCPSCVQSPKCGNGNNPLDKASAVRVLTAVMRALPSR